MSGLFKLNQNDLIKGAITAAVAAIVGVIFGVVNQPNFDLFALDWAVISKSVANAAFYGFVGYLGKNLLTDSEGKILGRQL